LSKVSGTNYDVNWVSVATAAQGAKADTATQPEDLGTAAVEDVGYFATAAQGAKADLAAPKASPTFTGDVLIPDGNADGEALAHSQDGAVLKGLTIGDGGTYPRVSIDATIAGYLDFKKSGVGEFYISNGQTGGGRLSIHALAANRHPIEIQADGRLDLDDALSVNVPVPTTTGHALRQGSNATVAALTATGDVKIPDGNADGEALAHSQDGWSLGSGSFTKAVAVTGSGASPSMAFRRDSTDASWAIQAATEGLHFRREVDGVLSTIHAILKPSGEWAFDQSGTSVKVPVPTATGQALRQGSNATVAALTATGETNTAALTSSSVSVNSTQPQIELVETDAAANEGRWRMTAIAGDLYLYGRNDDGTSQMSVLKVDRNGTITLGGTGVDAVVVPAATAAGEALAHSQAGAVLDGLTSTGQVAVESGFPILSLEDTNGLADEKKYRFYVNNSALYLAGQKDDGTGVPIFTFKSADDNNGNAPSVSTYSPVVLDFDQAASVTVPAATAATQAAQVSAIDAATGRLAIGGIEMGSTGWRRLVEYDATGTLVSGTAFPTQFTAQTTGVQYIDIKRAGNYMFMRMSRFFTATTAIGAGAIISWNVPIPYGFTTDYEGVGSFDNAPISRLAGIRVFNNSLLFRFDSAASQGQVLFGNPSGGTSNYGPVPALDAWPTVLPGTQVTPPGT
jgi:hypothetical protein